jgi:predicted DNA-binding protein YlxM (UPF0122 family)
MTQSINVYSDLTDSEKKSLLHKLYIGDKLSFASIAKKYNTYANRIRRDAVKLGNQKRKRMPWKQDLIVIQQKAKKDQKKPSSK